MSTNGKSNGDTQLVKPQEANALTALSAFLKAREKTLADYVKNGVSPAAMVRLACFEMSRNEALAKCSPASFYASLIACAQLGLEPSGIRGEAYLVPFKGQCTLIPGWRGLIKLALRSKEVKSIYAHVVYEGDEFQVWLGSEPKVVHEPNLRGDAGDIVAVYAIAHLANGMHDVEVMTLGEIDKIRKASQGANGPAWTNHFEEMSRKTVIRRICKRLPLGDDYAKAAHVDAMAADGKAVQGMRDVIEVSGVEVPQMHDVEVVDESEAPTAATVADRVAARASAARGRE
jgi:recombination protein RecT